MNRLITSLLLLTVTLVWIGRSKRIVRLYGNSCSVASEDFFAHDINDFKSCLILCLRDPPAFGCQSVKYRHQEKECVLSRSPDGDARTSCNTEHFGQISDKSPTGAKNPPGISRFDQEYVVECPKGQDLVRLHTLEVVSKVATKCGADGLFSHDGDYECREKVCDLKDLNRDNTQLPGPAEIPYDEGNKVTMRCADKYEFLDKPGSSTTEFVCTKSNGWLPERKQGCGWLIPNRREVMKYVNETATKLYKSEKDPNMLMKKVVELLGKNLKNTVKTRLDYSEAVKKAIKKNFLDHFDFSLPEDPRDIVRLEEMNEEQKMEAAIWGYTIAMERELANAMDLMLILIRVRMIRGDVDASWTRRSYSADGAALEVQKMCQGEWSKPHAVRIGSRAVEVRTGAFTAVTPWADSYTFFPKGCCISRTTVVLDGNMYMFADRVKQLNGPSLRLHYSTFCRGDAENTDLKVRHIPLGHTGIVFRPVWNTGVGARVSWRGGLTSSENSMAVLEVEVKRKGGGLVVELEKAKGDEAFSLFFRKGGFPYDKEGRFDLRTHVFPGTKFVNWLIPASVLGDYKGKAYVGVGQRWVNMTTGEIGLLWGTVGLYRLRIFAVGCWELEVKRDYSILGEKRRDWIQGGCEIMEANTTDGSVTCECEKGMGAFSATLLPLPLAFPRRAVEPEPEEEEKKKGSIWTYAGPIMALCIVCCCCGCGYECYHVNKNAVGDAGDGWRGAEEGVGGRGREENRRRERGVRRSRSAPGGRGGQGNQDRRRRNRHYSETRF